MAMDALKNLTGNIPGWLTRLDDLGSQIDKRQAELAAVGASEPKSPDTRSLRNKGSQESLRPSDDGPSNIPDVEEQPLPMEIVPVTPQTPLSPAQDISRKPSTSGSGGLATSQNRTRDALAAYNSRARAQIKKKQKPSVISAEGAAPAYRTRSMIIVWYDSFVQGFFDDMVRFISSSRNLMRKAKMAAKVAQIKKMAEMEMPAQDANGDQDGLEPLPSLKYMSSRRLGGMGRASFGPMGGHDKPDAYDNLDKGLEYVQSTCEHGAHQFLRDADCHDEIQHIQKKMRHVLEMAHQEIERVQRDDPELARETGDLGKIRTCRPISVRRDLSASYKEREIAAAKEPTERLDAAKPLKTGSASFGLLEVDPNIGDEGIEADDAFDITKLQYRSTRFMRPPRHVAS